MDRRQKSIVAEFFTVIAVTAIAVVGLINFKDWVNRSEAIKAMSIAGEHILDCNEKNGMLPTEGYVKGLKPKIEGGVRMGDIQYRGLFIGPDAEPNEILLYSEKQYKSSFLDDGYVVLFLDGTVKWMPTDKFKKLLEQQQTQFERDLGGQ